MTQPPTWLAACRHDFRLACGFLTRLPGFQGAATPAEAPPGSKAGALGPALRLAPLAGLLVGVCGALAFWAAAGLGLPPLAAALIAVGVTVWITGALHEDGLADVADGFGGAFDRERKLAIMRDSRIGAYGVLALIFSVGLRAGALAAVGEAGAAAVLIAAHGLSRGLLAPAMLLLAPARGDGLGAGAGRPAPADACLGLGLGLLLAVLALGPAAGLVAGLIALAAAGLAGALAARQIGGYTGDVLGALQQVAEIAVFLSAAALLAT